MVVSLLWQRGPCSGGSGVLGGSYRQVSSGESHGLRQAGGFAHHPTTSDIMGCLVPSISRAHPLRVC